MVLKAEKRLHQLAQLAVEEQLPVVDDDHPLAQRFHIRHVVAGEQHGGPVAAVVLGTKVRMRRCMVTSRPMVGSSRKSTFGRCSSAPTISIFMRSPSDRLRTGLLHQVFQLQQLDELVAACG